MRALVQRVTSASVTVEGEVVGAIGAGLCVFVGITHSDDEAIVAKMATKLWTLRCVDDDEGVMNVSAADAGLPILVVSQFTLYGDTAKGRRPSWIAAARPEQAEPLVDQFVNDLRALGASVETGRFRTYMQVSIVNDGPDDPDARTLELSDRRALSCRSAIYAGGKKAHLLKHLRERCCIRLRHRSTRFGQSC